MTFEEIRKDIKARKYKPIYFLCGEEPFFIDRLTALLENTVLTEDEKAFNQTVLYGNDVSMSSSEYPGLRQSITLYRSLPKFDHSGPGV